ncbi:hypothetical protein [Allonocardiopsis opalescens]|uniref:Subtilisin inhibitor-like n=1 Tax=Allonocardiopsis opalescens TaxID=1144618 RepID=A0A2T0QC23_9ACTN|nr:hypothetical protein [Allonocardiopsis opalescens]PRY01448.1 hypothetical protein CLV72_10130 [Allonocardiopsis opalescens]
MASSGKGSRRVWAAGLAAAALAAAAGCGAGGAAGEGAPSAAPTVPTASPEVSASAEPSDEPSGEASEESGGGESAVQALEADGSCGLVDNPGAGAGGGASQAPSNTGEVLNPADYEQFKVWIDSGEVGCEEALLVVESYYHEPPDAAQGDSGITEVDGWLCGAVTQPITGVAGRIAGCQSDEGYIVVTTPDAWSL